MEERKKLKENKSYIWTVLKCDKLYYNGLYL